MTYNKNSFNKDANFTSVIFGSDKPLLEAELNELQSIQHAKSTETIKALYGDVVVGKGEYSYITNTFSLKNECVILNGNLITVDSVSIVANSGDTIYFQSWIEEVTFESTLKKYGNVESATTVPNTIKDTRFNIETTRRGQLKYKLSTSEDLSKSNLKLGRIINGKFILDCPSINNFKNQYETPHYITMDNTKEGYISNLRIEGKSLTNIMTSYAEETSLESVYPNGNNNVAYMTKLKPNTVYTLIYKAKYNQEGNTGSVVIQMSDTTGEAITTNQTLTTSYTQYAFKFTSPSVVTCFVLRSSNDSFYIKECILLEGDYATKPPNYFSNILSTGQDLEVMKLKSINKNLFNINDLVSENNSYNRFRIEGNTVTITKLTSNNSFVGAYIDTEIGASYTLSFKGNSSINNTEATVYMYSDRPWGTSIGKTTSTTLDVCNYTFVAQSKKTYIGLYCGSVLNVNEDLIISDIIIRKGTSPSSSYIPQKKHTKQLLYKNSEGNFVPIPVLRGINANIQDTIELHSNGKYYYHKRCDEIVFDGSSDENWKLNAVTSGEPYIRFYIGVLSSFGVAFNLNFVCNTFNPDLIDSESVGECILGSKTQNMHFKLFKTRLTTQDIDGFRTWLSQNPTRVVYQLATEEIYECTYLDLNTYEGETTLLLDSGTISSNKVSFNTTTNLPSLVVNMKEEVDKNTKFREEMEESVTLTREFETGYEIFEDTKESSVTINKIEGNTLVNLLGKPTNSTSNASYTSDGVITFNQATTTTGVNHRVVFNNALVYPNKTYTLVFTVTKNTLTNTSSSENVAKFNLIHNGSGNFYLKRGVTGRQIVVLTQPSESTGKAYIEVLGTCTGELVIRDCYVLEEDQTALLPSYFEGLKSVGDLETLEIQSTNANLVTNSFINATGKGTTGNGQHYSDIVIMDNTRCMTNLIRVTPNTIYNINIQPKNKVGEAYAIIEFDRNKYQVNDTGWLSNTVSTYKTSSKGEYVVIIVRRSDNTTISTGEVMDVIHFSKNVTTFTSPKYDKKVLYFKNADGLYEKPVLRSLPSGIKDTIEKHSDGKYYYHKRCEKIILNGSENWSTHGSLSPTTNNVFFILTDDISPYEYSPTTVNVISDILLYTSRKDLESDIEGIAIHQATNYQYYSVGIAKSKLTESTATGFKKWLQSNNLTLVKQVQEEVYECVNLDLDSYEGETNITFPSVIPAKVKASVGSNLLATIENLKDRVHYLETGLSDMTENGSGWCKLPNGMIMQWGETYYQDLVKDVWVDKKITLPITLKKCLSVFVTTNGHSRGANRYFHVMKLSNDVTTTNTIDVSLITGTNSTWGGVNYLVFGYC